MKVLITGGAGYIGNEVVYKLAVNKNIEQIVIYDNLHKGNYNLFTGLRKVPKNNIKFIHGDILDSRLLRKSLHGIDTVIHLAANVTTPFSDNNPHYLEQVNHWGTAELVYAIEESDVKNLVYMSSASVYGARENEAEITTLLNPRTHYGISKMRGEEHVARMFEKLNTYIVRCANVYGYSKNLRVDAVINKFMLEAHYEGRIKINGDGNQSRSFIYINRVTDFLEKLLESNLDSAYFNLVDRNMSVLDIVEAIKEIYPATEMIFVNHHMKMKELKVKADEQTKTLLGENPMTLVEELQEFKKMFTF